ncbi:MAG: hypothetical protein LBR52_04690 [Prevotellaceae bacterium]|jgi:microcystin-dependent protein|nr:hypothetical protein [Prevotellaceae bacterium]
MNVTEALLRTHGNFTDFPTRDFPLDCEGMASMQMNESLLSVLGNIGGDRYILSEPNTSKGGYVFLATRKEPAGELLYVEKKSASNASTVYIRSEPVNINVQGSSYNGAYTKRWLDWGNGEEQFAWADFKRIQTNLSLQNRIEVLEAKIVPSIPSGVITMWSGNGNNVPEGWVICNGLNNTPDLRGRFIVGSSDTVADYKGTAPYSGKRGTSESYTVTLTENNLPAHNHVNNSKFNKLSARASDVDNNATTKALDSGSPTTEYMIGRMDNYWDVATIKTVGRGQSFDIRPPYYALAFIMKL